MAVLLAGGFSIPEHHARSHRMSALQVGVVEAFDVPRLSVEAQLLLNGIHQPLGIPFGILDFEVFQLLGAVDAGALPREFQQFEFLPALRDRESHAFEQQRRRGQQRHDHLAGEFASGDVFDDVLDGQRQHVALVAPDARREFHGLHAHDRTVADAHEVAPGHVVVGQQRENVDVDDLRADDHRPSGIVVQGVEPLFVPLRQLEFQLPGRTRHLPFEVLAHGTQVAFQHRNDHADQLRILLLGLPPDARGLAVAQVVLQADRIFISGDQLRGEVEFAGPQGDHLADEVEHAALHHHRSVGAEILRPVARQDARRLHAGKALAPHDDPRIGLVVLEQDVVTRLKALDQRVFQQQGVGLAPHDDMADLDDLLHQHTHLRAVLLRLHEVRRHPLAQALGLTHIDDRPRAVHELVDARRQRQQGHLLLEIRFFRFSHTPCKFSKYIANRKVYKKVAFFV